MKFSLTTNNVEEKEIEWFKWSTRLSEEGSCEVQVSKLSFNEERSVFYLIDQENETGTSVFCTNHPDSKFQSTPHGVRLANAIGRAYALEGEVDAETLCESVSNGGATVRVEKTDKGVLWTVKPLK